MVTPARTRAVVAIGAALVLLVGAYLFLVIKSDNVAAGGTTVAGVDIGGMSQDEAQAAVRAGLGELVAKKLRVRVGQDVFPVRPQEFGASLDPAASVEPAYSHVWNPVALVSHLWSGSDLPAVVTVDDDRLSALVDEIGQVVDQPAQEPTLELRSGKAVLSPGSAGRELDREAMADVLTAALAQPRQPIEAVMKDVSPTVSDEAAQQAVALAEQAAAGPVTVSAGTVTAQIPGKEVRRALTFTAQDGELVPALDGEILHAAIAEDLAPIEVEGRDATFKIRGGKVKVVKSKVGSGVSDEELASAVAKVLSLPPAERRVTVSVGTREPSLTTQEARDLGIKERISSFTQQFPYAAYRVQNIGQAAERINGTILLPGKTFSLNDTILERTKENGYTEGFVVGEGGVFEEALGGGVSTSATTAWTAAFYAGMDRVQTVAHSIYISRYKPGLEATVAWGIFDMKFRNPGPNAVFITAGITNTSVTVSFWGTKQYDIEAEFGPRRNIVPFEKIYDGSDTCLGQEGVDGFTITVDRVFYKDGVEVKREPITTRYKPAPKVVCGKDPGDKGKKKDGKDGKDTADGTKPDANPDQATDPATADTEPSQQPNGEDTFAN